jgi:hypothetical protein
MRALISAHMLWHAEPRHHFPRTKMNDYQKYGEYSREVAAGESAKTALLFLGIGIGVGALLSLLLAPRSGSEIRQVVRGKFDDARRGLDRQTSRVREQARRMAGQTREKVMPISRTQ